jgi:branched-subunit amino acid aminotransferase/4-amino-4-deoxychorismate lyase
MLTTLCAVRPAGGAELCHGLLLITASLQDGALPGVLRRRVLQACQQLQLEVLEQAPCLDQSDSWVEAFVTNALRGVQPVGSLVLPGAGGEPPATERVLALPELHGPVTRALQQAVARLQQGLPV